EDVVRAPLIGLHADGEDAPALVELLLQRLGAEVDVDHHLVDQQRPHAGDVHRDPLIEGTAWLARRGEVLLDRGEPVVDALDHRDAELARLDGELEARTLLHDGEDVAGVLTPARQLAIVIERQVLGVPDVAPQHLELLGSGCEVVGESEVESHCLPPISADFAAPLSDHSACRMYRSAVSWRVSPGYFLPTAYNSSLYFSPTSSVSMGITTHLWVCADRKSVV